MERVEGDWIKESGRYAGFACRSASRDWYEPDDRYEDLGFRVLLYGKNDSSQVV